MQITKITEQIKNSSRVSVFVDGRYGFSLSLDQLLDSHLKIGQEIDDTQLKRFKDDSSEGKLKMRALEWLMIRPHSIKEFGDYLKRKSLSVKTIENWTNEFQAKKYLNDETFSKWWLEQRLNKFKSLASVKFELRRKGVSDEIINALIESNQHVDKLSLKLLITKKRQSAKYQDDKKLVEYLMRQGYRYSSIKELLTE